LEYVIVEQFEVAQIYFFFRTDKIKQPELHDNLMKAWSGIFAHVPSSLMEAARVVCTMTSIIHLRFTVKNQEISTLLKKLD